MTPAPEIPQNGLDLAEMIDPKSWPKYLVNELRLNRKAISEVNANMEELTKRMNDFEHNFNGKMNEAITSVMAEHLKYHNDNETRWGFVTWAKKNIGKAIILGIILGILLNGVVGISIGEFANLIKKVF